MAQQQLADIRPQRILRLEVRSVMAVKAVDITPQAGQNLIVVGGKNGQGKSSALRSLAWAFEGARDIADEPLRRGEAHGHVLAETDDYIVVRHFLPGNATKLVLSGKDGRAFPSPQALLDRLITDLSFDPYSFIKKKPQEQAEMLRKLLGLDFAALDARRASLTTKRTLLKAEKQRFQSRFDTFPFHPDAPEQPVSVDNLLTQLGEASAVNTRNSNARHALASLEREEQSVLSNIDSIGADIERLQRELEAKLKQQATFTDMLADVQQRREAQQATVNALEDADEEGLTAQLRDAEAVNQKVDANRRRMEAAQELEAKATELDAVQAELTAIDDDKRAQIAAAQFPVAGLSFDENGGLRLDDFPFSQACRSDQLRTAIAIAKGLNPLLRVIVIEDGDKFDAEHMDVLRQLADEFNVQIWMERVGDGEEVSVVIHDGEVLEDRMLTPTDETDEPRELTMTLPFAEPEFAATPAADTSAE